MYLYIHALLRTPAKKKKHCGMHCARIVPCSVSVIATPQCKMIRDVQMSALRILDAYASCAPKPRDFSAHSASLNDRAQIDSARRKSHCAPFNRFFCNEQINLFSL